jgi:hypothetical protein
MEPVIHFAESAKEAERQDRRLGGEKPAETAEPAPLPDDFVPARDRWKPKRRKKNADLSKKASL